MMVVNVRSDTKKVISGEARSMFESAGILALERLGTCGVNRLSLLSRCSVVSNHTIVADSNVGTVQVEFCEDSNEIKFNSTVHEADCATATTISISHWNEEKCEELEVRKVKVCLRAMTIK